jgi:NADH-quinone oxidoreductase subunit E
MVQDSTHIGEPIRPQVLIVANEANVAKGLEMILVEEGCAVDLATTGCSALESFDKKVFDLLIADLRLPDIDGMEVIEKAKQCRPDTGMIAISEHSTVPSATEATKLGVALYLPKPFTKEEVIAAVKAALDSKGLSKSDPSAAADNGQANAVLEPLPEDLMRVEEIMAQIRKEFPRHQEVLIPILQRFQSLMGFIPKAALEEIAQFTHTPAASVYGVATFYEQFRLHPVGRHIIKVCRGTACHVKGAERILNEIETRFQLSPGQTSSDRMFTLETVACFGSCAIAPVVVADDKVKARMNPAKTRQVMEDIHGADASQREAANAEGR